MGKDNANLNHSQIRFEYCADDITAYRVECSVTRNLVDNGDGLPRSVEHEVEITRAEESGTGVEVDLYSVLTPGELNDLEYQAAQHAIYGLTLPSFFSNELDAATMHLSECIDAEVDAEAAYDEARSRYETALRATNNARKEVKRIKQIQREVAV